MLRSVVVLLFALGLLVPSAAYAEKWGADDPTGDVHGSTYDPEPQPCGTITDWNATANAAVDITRLSVNHTRDTVILTLRFRNLLWAGPQLTEFAIRTNERGYLVNVDRHRTGGRSHVDLYREPQIPEPDPDAECDGVLLMMSGMACTRLTGQIRPDRDVVRVSIPRRCLSAPTWVRAGAWSQRFVDGRSYFDRWAPPGSDQTGFFGPYGPRVRPS